MNSKSLLNIINIIIKNEEKFEESPNEIYSLFKKHGYEGNIETLKLDLKNLLDDVIKSDEELSKVAGGKVSKLVAGAVAALTCFPMNSFASGITDAIKSGAKKVGDATNEYVIEPAKDAAKTIARHPGVSATMAGALVAYGLLSGLAGKKLASPPQVVTQEMTAQERQKVETTYNVLHELTEKNYVEIEDNDKEKGDKEYSWDLTKLSKTTEGLSDDKIKIGELVETKLMPEQLDLDKTTTAYTQARKAYIAYENAVLKMLKQQEQRITDTTKKLMSELETENERLQNLANQNAETLTNKQKEIETEKEKYEKQLEKKDEEIKSLNAGTQATIQIKLNAQKTTFEEKLTKLEAESKQKTKKFQEQLNKQKLEIQKKNQENIQLQSQLTILKTEVEQQTTTQLLLPSYTNLNEICKTIDDALGNVGNLKSLKDQITKVPLEAIRQFRRISNHLRSDSARPVLTVTEKKINGKLSLAERLLVGALSKVTVTGQTNLEDGALEGFGSDIKTALSLVGGLTEAARSPHSWVAWLAPVHGTWSTKEGIKEYNVVKQLPELILAAAVFDDTTILKSLLTALEELLTSPENSKCRGQVNAALKKVGIRFDDKIYRLVSTIQEKQ